MSEIPNFASVQYSSDVVSEVSVTIILYGESDAVFSTASATSPDSVVVGTGVSSSVSAATATTSVSSIAAVYTTNIPTSINPTQQSYIPEIISTVQPTFSKVEVPGQLNDPVLVNILSRLIQVRNNVAKITSNEKSEWSQSIIENISDPDIGRSLIKIMTANYSKLGTVKNRIAARR